MSRTRVTTVIGGGFASLIDRCQLLLAQAPLMSDSYGFYRLDRRFRPFRACHATAYRPAAREQGGYPLTVEILDIMRDTSARIQTWLRIRRDMTSLVQY